jgi:hypothetical protein
MLDHQRPHHIAIASDDGVRATALMRLVWIQRRVYAAEDDRDPATPRRRADFVAAQRVAGVDPNPDDVTSSYSLEIERLERFINDARSAVRRRGGAAKDEHPPRGDHSDPKDRWLGLTKCTVIAPDPKGMHRRTERKMLERNTDRHRHAPARQLVCSRKFGG